MREWEIAVGVAVLATILILISFVRAGLTYGEVGGIITLVILILGLAILAILLMAVSIQDQASSIGFWWVVFLLVVLFFAILALLIPPSFGEEVYLCWYFAVWTIAIVFILMLLTFVYTKVKNR